MMQILVIGGAGFIGRYVVKSLLKKGYNITIFDNFSNSKDTVNFITSENVKIIKGDITNIVDICKAMNNQDIVIHLAAKISVLESIKNPADTFAVNVKGTRNVLDGCKKNNIKKLIVASSAAVYGESAPNIILAEDSELNPISPYGASKVKMEQEIREFESKNNIDCIILRFFNIFGIGQSAEYAGVVTKFIERITADKHLEIFGDGLQTRDFVAAEDVADLISNIIEHGDGGTYNIASGKSHTIVELAKLLILHSKKNLEIKFSAAKKGDIRNSHADISKAKKELEFSPKFGLEAIKKLLE